MSDLDFTSEDEGTGGSKWPTRTFLHAIHPEHGEVGTLNYFQPRRKADGILIGYLEVPGEHQGHGYGSALMDEMQRRHPGIKIDHGDRTDAGKAWWKSYTRGKPVRRGRTMANYTFDYAHNTEKAPRVQGYGQDVEPHGRYLTARDPHGNYEDSRWELGTHTFHNPKYMPFGGGYDEESNWKNRLSQEYQGKKGRSLSRALLKDGYDGIITHDEEGPREIVDLTPLRTGVFLPTKRLFGPTQGLDHRLFDGDHLKPDVRKYILETLTAFWKPTWGYSWENWAKIYFAGSEASEWTSPELEGNNDFDVLIGINYSEFRKHQARGSRYQQMSDQDITDELNKNFRKLDEQTAAVYIPVEGYEFGPFNNTWYVNPDSWDIRTIRPYAAYNVTDDTWAVKPPHLPDWSIKDFPEGPALLQEAQAVSAYVRAVLALPEPYRSQQGYALWQHLHSDRSRAFSAQGEGWFDPGNVLEKWLDQEGLWDQLVKIMVDVRAHPEHLNTPATWSNDPLAAAS